MGGEAVCDYFALGFGSYGKTIGKRLSEELDTLIMTGICCGWRWRRAESMGGSLGRRKCAGTFSTVPMCIRGCVTAREWGVCPGQGGLRSWLGSLHHREAPCGLRAAGTGGFLDQQGIPYIETVMLWIRAAGAEWLIEKTDKNCSTYYRYYVGRE